MTYFPGYTDFNQWLQSLNRLDADYSTNAPSYYEELARNRKLFELIAKKIWDYDQELAKRFAAWDKNLEEFPEDVKNLLIEWLRDGTLAGLLADEYDRRTIGIYPVGLDGNVQAAIDKAYAAGGGIVKLPYGNLTLTQPLVMKDRVTLQGHADDPSGSQLIYNGTGFAIRTGTSHLRQGFSKFALKLGPVANGILIGDTVANLNRDAGILPRQMDLESINIQDLTGDNIGIKFWNASHITMKKVRSAYGSGGIGVQITCDGYNSGVFSAIECSFGRYDGTNIGLDMINNSGGLDGYTFTSCYFGGQLPVWLHGVNETSAPKSITFVSPHIEPRGNVCFDINKVRGLTVTSPTLAGFGRTGMIGFLFRTQCHGLSILGAECNEWGTGSVVYKQEGTSSSRTSILGEASFQGGAGDTVQFNGEMEYILRYGGRVKQDYMETKNLFFSNGNRITFGTLAERPTQASRGDEHRNSAPALLGTAGSQYIINGWKCVSGSSTAATWEEMRGFTGK